MRKPFRKLRLILVALLTLEIALGIVLIIVAAIYQGLLSSFIIQTESGIISSRFVHVYIMGFQLIALYLGSLPMWKSIWVRRFSRSIQILLNIWMFVCFLIVISGCVAIWSFVKSSKVLSDNVAMMLLHGIEVYYTKPEWKFLWDQLQYGRECCGVNRYSDWMRASWMSMSYGGKLVDLTKLHRTYFDYEGDSDVDSQTIRIITDCIGKKLNSQGNAGELNRDLILAPYACCRPDSPSCYQNYLPQLKESSFIPQMNISEINTISCMTIFNHHLSCATIIFVLLTLVGVLIDILICCLTKYFMAQSKLGTYQELCNDMSPDDNDDGTALVVVKCPPKVKLIVLDESNSFDSDIPNFCTDSDPCTCCCELDGDGINVSSDNAENQGINNLLLQ
ncbi:tetraspanin 33B [Haematobia irritans]|uniref:tetraspanin 33B n=1 Tax=Haematobia irritans TaxID=7368 RepID=UPI003F4F5215